MKTRLALNVVMGTSLALVVLYAGASLCVIWQAYQTKRNAEVLLGELRKMKVGETTLEDVQRLAAGSQKQFLAKGTDPFCQDIFCTYMFNYYAAPLGRLVAWHLHTWRLYLTPASVNFNATLTTQGDRLVRIEMALSSGILSRSVSATVDDEVPEISPVPQPYVYSAQSSHIWIYVKPSATAAQREGAYSFNLNCIDRLGGCRRVSELLPRAH